LVNRRQPFHRVLERLFVGGADFFGLQPLKVYPARNLVVVGAVGPRRSSDVQDVYEQFSKLVQAGRVAAQIQAVLQDILKD
jgi:hypothetical protein